MSKDYIEKAEQLLSHVTAFRSVEIVAELLQRIDELEADILGRSETIDKLAKVSYKHITARTEAETKIKELETQVSFWKKYHYQTDSGTGNNPHDKENK